MKPNPAGRDEPSPNQQAVSSPEGGTMKATVIVGFIVVLVGALACAGAVPASTSSRVGSTQGGASFAATPVLDWSNEARRAIVPAGPGGIFGAENYGNKFPGEAAIYLAIVHAAIYDAAVALEGGYEPYAAAVTAPANTSAAAAIATAAHHTLVGLQPQLGLSPAQQAILDGDYLGYMNAIADGPAKANGTAVGEQVAAAMLALRANDGREKNPTLADL